MNEPRDGALFPVQRSLDAAAKNGRLKAETSASDTSEGDVNFSPRRAAWQDAYLSEGTKALLDQDARHFLHQSLSTPCLNALAACKGSSIEDVEGRRFLDFHGNSAHQVGYGNPRVMQAVHKQMDVLPFCPRRYANLPALRLAGKLAQLAPGDLNKVLFAPAGSLAVGMALKLARVATGRFKTLSLWDSFHGASMDALSVGGEALFRKGLGPLLPGTEHAPPPDPRACLWDEEGRCESCGLKCAAYIDYVLEREGDVGAVIAEPIRCTVAVTPPTGYWQAVRRACDRHGALLIFDETAVCLGRTGRMFACEHFGATPDILVLGKGLGGGVMPLAAMVAAERLDVAARTALGHYTHEKSPVACAAGLATIACLEEDGLIERSARLGEGTLRRLHALKAKHPLVAEVRGLGFLLAVVLEKPDPERPDKTVPASAEADQAMYECLSRGLSFKVSAGNVLTLTPPLTISEAELDQALAALDESLSAVEQALSFPK